MKFNKFNNLFGSKKEEVELKVPTHGWEWKFKAISQDEYQLYLETVVPNGLITAIVSKMGGVAKDHKENVEIHLREHGRIEIAENYFENVRKSISQNLKDVFNNVGADCIDILNHVVRKAEIYRFAADKWKIQVLVGGLYKRR